MKQTMLAFALIVLITRCSNQENSDGYTLTGTINGVPAGKVKLMATNHNDRTSIPIDSAEFTGGKFTLRGKIKNPEMMSIVIEPGNWSFQAFMENSDITIKADTAGASYYDWTAYGYSKGAEIKNYTITGSESQDQWMKFENDPRLKAFQPMFESLNKAYQEAAGKSEDAYKIKNQADSLRGIFTTLQKKLVDSFVNTNPSSAASAYMFHYYYMYNNDMPLQDMETLAAKLTGPAKSTLYYTIVTEAIKRRQALLPGSTAPDFTLKKPDSSSLSLSSLRGKYVLLDFWASWCVPCRQAIPHWKEVYKKYQPAGLEILGVTNDSKWSDWYKALEEEKMPWPQVADEFPVKNMPSRVGELYMTPYLPTYILLDKEGKIILYNANEQQIEEKLKEIFRA